MFPYRSYPLRPLALKNVAAYVPIPCSETEARAMARAEKAALTPHKDVIRGLMQGRR